MRNVRLATVLLIIFPITAVCPARGAVPRPRGLALGVSDSGGTLRYAGANRYTAELKGQAGEDSAVYGLRVLRYFSSEHAWVPFLGIEADYVTFDADQASGAGAAGEAFAGLEYFFAKRFSVQFDMGAAYIAVKEDRYSLSDTGVDFIANFQLNFYFSKRGEK